MTHCSGQYGVRVNGKLHWFTTADEARTAERAELCKLRTQNPVKRPSYKILVKGL